MGWTFCTVLRVALSFIKTRDSETRAATLPLLLIGSFTTREANLDENMPSVIVDVNSKETGEGQRLEGFHKQDQALERNDLLNPQFQ